MLLGSAPAASEEITALISRGVVELHFGMRADPRDGDNARAHYAEAVTLFTKALEAEPANAYALYYRGVTRGRLLQWDAAVADLRRVLELAPDLTSTRLELGVALLKSGRAHDAIPWLTLAQTMPELEATSSFYLGIAQLREKNLHGAEHNFQRAAAADSELSTACGYYLGIVALQAGKLAAAKSLFERVVAEARPDSAIRVEAQEFLLGLEQGQWPTRRRIQLYADVGLEYDSNVQLAPLDDELASDFGKQEDGRSVISAGGSYLLWRGRDVQVGAAYDFFQSLHFDLTEFNIQSHRPSVFLNAQLGRFSGGLMGAYGYYLRETDSFVQEAEAFPWVSLEETNLGRTQVFYRFRRRDFKELSLRKALDSFAHAIGVDQYFYLGAVDRFVVAGYRYDRLDPADGAEDNFMYHANQGWAGIAWSWPYAVNTQLDFAYRAKNYRAASDGRHDDEYRIIFSAQRPVARYASLGLGYSGTFNESNQAVFEYQRHIVSVSVQVRF